MDVATLKEFGTKYAAAWCSQNTGSVAAFFGESGSLKINDGAPAVGRTAITAAAQDFMTAFRDMVVTLDGVVLDGDRALYRWTLTGTNMGPGGAGKVVRISGYEEWTFGADGLIADSKGHFGEGRVQPSARKMTNHLTRRCSRRSASTEPRYSTRSDYELVWDVVRNGIPELPRQLAAVLEEKR